MKKNKNKYNKKKKKQVAYSQKQLKMSIMSVFNKKPNANYNYKQVAKRLGINDVTTKHQISSLLRDLKKDKKLKEISTGKYRLLKESGYLTGIVDLTQKGSAYVICEGQENDVFVSQRNLHGALGGDEVKIYPGHGPASTIGRERRYF